MSASTTLIEFLSALSSVTEMLAMESRYSDPPTRQKQNLVSGLRAGSVVLMVGAFEFFFQRCVQHHLSIFAGKSALCRIQDLPERLRRESVIRTAEAALRESIDGAVNRKEERYRKVVAAAKAISTQRLTTEAVSSVKSNPDSQAISDVLKAIGIDEPFKTVKPLFEKHWPKPESETFIPDKLTEIVSKRNRAAHTASGLWLSRVELWDYVAFFCALGEALDETIEGHTSRIVDRLSERMVGPRKDVKSTPS